MFTTYIISGIQPKSHSKNQLAKFPAVFYWLEPVTITQNILATIYQHSSFVTATFSRSSITFFHFQYQVIINVELFQCVKKRSRCGHFSVCLWLMETERVCSPRVHWDSICVPEFPSICSTPWGVSSNGWWVILWYRHYITVSLPAQCSLIIHKTHTQSSEPMVQHHITYIYSTRTSHTHTPQINNYYLNCVVVICDIYCIYF